MTTIQILGESPLPPERVLAAAYDFSARRAEVFPAVSAKRQKIHELQGGHADVTEGTRAGPIVNWERGRYDWSQPGTITATVTDSNVYAVPGSSWTMRASPKDGGSSVEMVWAREFRRRPRGLLFGTLFAWIGNRLFGRYAREVLENVEKLDAEVAPTASPR